MGATAFDVKLGREVGFYRSMVGRKAIVAVTGAMLFAYLVAHLIGNLQILAGPDRINAAPGKANAAAPLPCACSMAAY